MKGFTLVSLTIIITLSLLGCGKNSRIKKSQTKFTRDIWGDPILLQMFDKDCNTKNAVTDPGMVTLDYMLFGGIFESMKYSFHNYSGKRLRGEIVEFVAYNFMLKQVGKKTPLVISEPRALNICQNDYNYPTNSLEDVALSSIYSIDQSYDFYKLNSNNEKHLDQIALFVHPIVMKSKIDDETGKEYKYSLVDNASYSFVGKMISIYPQSKRNLKFRKYLSGVPLWKIPFIMAHEFGHHIFHTYFQKENKAITSYLEKLKSINIRDYDRLTSFNMAFDTIDLSTSAFVHKVSTAALHEMFADLFATYSQNFKASSLKNLTCFEKSRDVNSLYFGNEIDKKVLSLEVVNIYSRNIKREISRDCNDPNFYDEHTIGAILAYGLDKLMDSSTINLTRHERFKLLLRWAKKLDDNFNIIDKTKIRTFLRDSIDLFIDELKAKSSLNKKQCQVVSAIFPSLFTVSYNSYCDIVPIN